MQTKGRVAGIMQPYFFPYLGYWQLVSKVDVFVILQRVKFVKQSWINRNFVLGSGENVLISVPLEKASDFALIEDRKVSDVWTNTRGKILRQIQHVYGQSPFFEEISSWLKEQLSFPEKNLSNYLEHQIRSTASLLDINTKIVAEKDLGDFSEFERSSRIFGICKSLECDAYLNLPGGRSLYSRDSFRKAHIKLGFLDPFLPAYPQGRIDFVSSLSVIDSLFWNGPMKTAEMVRLGDVQWE